MSYRSGLSALTDQAVIRSKEPRDGSALATSARFEIPASKLGFLSGAVLRTGN